MLLSRVLFLVLLVFSAGAFAGSVNVNMSNTAAQFEAGFSAQGNGEFQTGFLYNDTGSVLIDGGLLVKGGGDQEGGSGMTAGGGVKAVAGLVQQGSTTYTASCIALGGQGSFTPPAVPSVSLVGEFFTSLKITTYGDANHFSEFALRVEVGPPHAKIFVGYREIAFSMVHASNVTVDKGGYAGLNISF